MAASFSDLHNDWIAQSQAAQARHFGAQNDLLRRTEDAIRDENDSRASQAREQRRMQHVKDLESMRQEGLLQRLQAMNDSSYEPPERRKEGPIRVFDPTTGRWISGFEHVIENGAAYLDGRRYS